MTFKVVFDAAQVPADYGRIITVGLPLFFVGLLLVAQPALMQHLLPQGLQGRVRTVLAWLFLLVSAVVTTIATMNTFINHEGVVASLQNGNYKSVEGIVSDFKPMPPDGHGLESFVVSGQHFSYSDYISTAGFHKSTLNGGPIRPGMSVRILYNGNSILRLEVEQ